MMSGSMSEARTKWQPKQRTEEQQQEINERNARWAAAAPAREARRALIFPETVVAESKANFDAFEAAQAERDAAGLPPLNRRVDFVQVTDRVPLNLNGGYLMGTDVWDEDKSILNKVRSMETLSRLILVKEEVTQPTFQDSYRKANFEEQLALISNASEDASFVVVLRFVE